MRTYNLYYDEIFFASRLQKICRKFSSQDALLVQIFCNQESFSHITPVLNTIKKYHQNIVVIGASSDGEFIGSHVSTDQMIVSISAFEKSYILPLSQNCCDEGNFDKKISCFEFGQNFVATAEDNPMVLITFATSNSFNAEEFLNGIQSIFPNLIIAGGLAAGSTPFVFDKDDIYYKGAVGVLIYSSDLIVQTTSRLGWTPIGKEMTITKANKNRVYTIDNHLATDVYRYYLGDDIINMMPKLGMQFPLMNTHGTKIRTLTQINSDGSIDFAGNLQSGEKLCFAHGDKEHLLGSSINVPKDFLNKSFESIFIYSCAGRRMFMPDGIYREIQPYTKLGDVSGFFTHGEFLTSHNGHNILHQSMTVLAMSEKSYEGPSAFSISEPLPDLGYYYSQKAMMHLIKRSSQEIEALNKELENKVAAKVEENRKKDILLMHQSKLAALGEMIGNIAHQWRQPLNLIGALNMQMQVEAGNKGYVRENEYAKIADKIDNQLEFMSNTIDDFRAFANPNAKYETFNLPEVITNTAKLVKPHYETLNIQLFTRTHDTVLKGTKSDFKHVIINLLNNAKDAITSHGKYRDNYIFVTTYKDKNTTCIDILDTGGGIDPSLIDKIFDPYFSTKSKSKSTGIGLYMCHEIIHRRFQGTFKVKNKTFDYHNKTYKGALFQIRI